MDPSLFVSRDRARRFGHALAQAAQERRLAWRGADVGMASLTNEALKLLDGVAAEAQAAALAVLGGRLRDRERGYLDVPFTVMAEGVAERAALAARLERARVAGRLQEREAQAGVLDLLEEAQRRIDAFCAAYDEKRPVALSRAVDLARMLSRVERDAAFARTLRPPEDPAADATAPEVVSSPDALEDLLRAARAALPEARGPWHVERGRAGAPLRLSLGAAGSGAVVMEPPARLERAARVLAFVHPVTVRALGRAPATAAPAGPARRDWGATAAPEGPALAAVAPATTAAEAPALDGLEIDLPDPAAGGTELAAASGAGEEARLSPGAERAVRALMAAPPLPEHGAAPPRRTIALLGLLRALDDELARALLPRLKAGRLRAAAAALPREDTRKARLEPGLVAALVADLPALPVARLEDLVEDLARGRAGRRRCNAGDAALLLALFARRLVVGGYAAEPSLDLAPLAEAQARALAADLLDVAAVRVPLEGGGGVDAAALTRLERAAVVALGLLGRLA